MKNKLDNFESFIKDSLDNHEAAYNAASWSVVSQALDGAKKPFYKTKGFIAGAAAVLVAGAIFLSIPSQKDKETALNVTPSDYITKQKEVNDTKVADNEPNIIDNNNPSNRDYIASNDITTSNEAQDQLNANETNSLPTGITPNSNEKRDHNSTNLSDRDYLSDTPKEDEGDEEDNSTNPRDYTPSTTEESNPKDYLATFTAENSICEGTEINLTANAGKDVSTIEWKVNGKTISQDRDYKFKPTTTGNKEIILLAKNKEGKIVATDTKIIKVIETPSTQLNVVEEEFALVNKQTFNVSSDLTKLTWDFGDGATSKEAEVTHTYPKQGNYNLSYTVENENGCKSSATRKISINGYYNIRRDFGFSPDGDGSLDLFMPAELKLINRPIEMTIYSASSKQIVYQTNSVDQPWNGIDMKTGTMAPFGPYVWIVTLTNELGHEEVYKGNLTKASK